MYLWNCEKYLWIIGDQSSMIFYQIRVIQNLENFHYVYAMRVKYESKIISKNE